ncbi:MAG: tetratricopeptide repeat protein, partial [Candidatus Obscuribacterales bacterium]|nr:tetratricopeptide repeat protein [Candidatus Obscuribacterales bacterium]
PQRDPLTIADMLTGLALIHHERRQHDRAEQLLLEALSLKEEAFGLDDPLLVETLNKLGRICQNQRKTEAAVSYYERANTIDHQQHGFFCKIWLDYDE